MLAQLEAHLQGFDSTACIYNIERFLLFYWLFLGYSIFKRESTCKIMFKSLLDINIISLRQQFAELNANTSETYGLHIPKSTHGLKN